MRNPHNRALSIVLLTVFVVSLIACSRRPSDATIAKDIQEKVAADPETKDSEVSVAANSAKVTLSGKVKSRSAQQKVERIAREEPGVADVNNRTAVEPESTSAPKQAVQATTPAPVARVSKPKPQPIVVPAGTVLTVRTSQALSSKTSQAGQAFLATLAQPVSVGGKSALPAGSTVSGTVVSAKAKGKIKGEGELILTLNSISLGGHTYPIQTRTLDSTVKGKGKRTAATTGGGAAGGALIGGLAGGGKGAGIGALVGASAGLVGGALTGNKQVEIPAESALSFTLSASLTLPPRTN